MCCITVNSFSVLFEHCFFWLMQQLRTGEGSNRVSIQKNSFILISCFQQTEIKMLKWWHFITQMSAAPAESSYQFYICSYNSANVRLCGLTAAISRSGVCRQRAGTYSALPGTCAGCPGRWSCRRCRGTVRHTWTAHFSRWERTPVHDCAPPHFYRGSRKMKRQKVFMKQVVLWSYGKSI